MSEQNEKSSSPVAGSGSPGEGFRVIGVPRRRVDGRAKVTGQTKFADDVMLPRMAHCKLLRSTRRHARIVKVDVSRAWQRRAQQLAMRHPRQHHIVGKLRLPGDLGAAVARDELTALE